jgi:hypothetical protein
MPAPRPLSVAHNERFCRGALRRVVRRASLLGVLAAGGLLLASCEERVRRVSLSFSDDGDGPRGFLCKESAGDDYLLTRALDGGRASLVVDFIRLGGFPLCRPIKLLDWCRENGCEILGGKRACFDLPPLPSDAGEAFEAAATAVSDLEGSTVTSSAPDEPVLVRVVAVAATCAEVEAGGLTFDCAKLMGCANSCPVYLPGVDDVPLDLDVSGEQCEDAVVVCASADLGSPAASCPGAP